MVSETLSWYRGWRWPVDFWIVGVACVDAGGVRRVSLDFELVPWVGVAGAFGGEVVGGE
jgi:hypothetical protein